MIRLILCVPNHGSVPVTESRAMQMSGRRRGRQTTSNSRSKCGITDTVRAVSAASNVPEQKKL